VSQLHRIQWLDRAVREGVYPNCADLAKAFEISRRQAARDVEYLRYSLGAPVTFSPEKRGYYYTDRSFRLPAIHVSQEETELIRQMAVVYRAAGDRRAAQLADLFQKIGQSLGIESDFDHVTGDQWPVVPILEESILRNRKACVVYVDKRGNGTDRVVWPYRLFEKYGNNYLLAFCEKAQDLRYFRIERIRKVTISEGVFPKPSLSFDQYIEETFNRLVKPFTAQFAVSDCEGDGDENGFATMWKCRKIGDQCFECLFYRSQSFLSDLFSRGIPFRIEKPKWLKDRFLRRIERFGRFASVAHGQASPKEDYWQKEEKEASMHRVQLNQIEFGPSWLSYAGATYGVLKALGYWDEPIHHFIGKTGIGFHFVIQDRVGASGPTVYDWGSRHYEWLDRVGVANRQFNLYYQRDLNTFSLAQKSAVTEIKRSLEKGVGVVVWAPTKILEFGIITGFDDEDGVFFVKDCASSDPDPLKYDNLGLSDVPYLYYQLVEGRVDVSEPKMIMEAVRRGVAEWNQETAYYPFYNTGRKAYLSLIKALESEAYDSFGLSYCLSVYACLKSALFRFLSSLPPSMKNGGGLSEAGEHYRGVMACFEKARDLHPFTGSQMVAQPLSKATLRAVLQLMREAFSAEEEAMRVLKSLC